ncbi:MAG: septum site-determining protein MinD [Chloroflexi bacterium]|nr:septum site-determining protein MinD [Chloroflexota bacterium]
MSSGGQPSAGGTRVTDTRIITVTSGKGGVGKTTTTANIGVALARLGKRVVVIDTDIGLRNLDMMLGLQNRIIYDLVDLVEGRCRMQQALIRDRLLDELYLLPAAQTRGKSAVSPADMVRVCTQLRGECDYVLVDSPAGIDEGFRNAVAAADECLLVATPEANSVRGVDRVLGILEGKRPLKCSLIINRLRADMVRRKRSFSPDEMLETLDIDLIGIVPEAEEVLEANALGVPVAHGDESLAAQAYHNIARRMLGEEVPFLPLLEPVAQRRGLFGFLKKLAG